MKRHLQLKSFVLALLVLLVSLPGAAQPGGWFCASGVQCEPAASLTCCCGCPEGGRPGSPHCDEGETPEGRQDLAESCGCYYEAQALEPLLKAGRVVAAPMLALLPAPVTPLVHAVRSVPLPPPAATQSPPGIFVSSTLTRGPPPA